MKQAREIASYVWGFLRRKAVSIRFRSTGRQLESVVERGERMAVPNLRVPGPVLDPDRSAEEPEGLSNLVLQEALVREVQFDGPVGE